MSNLNPVIEETRKSAAQFVIKIAGRTLQRSGSKFEDGGGISLQVDRKVGDVINKFSLSIIDNGSNDVYEIDKTLSWSNADRSIDLIYGNKFEPSKLVKMSGYITDYSHTFVGSIYKLDITGYVSFSNATASIKNVAGFKYRFDFRNYFAKRKDNKLSWPVAHLADSNFLGIATQESGTFDVSSITDMIEYSQGTAIVSNNDDDLPENKVRAAIKKYKWENSSVRTFIDTFDNVVYTTVKSPKATGHDIKIPVPDLFVRWDGKGDVADHYIDPEKKPGAPDILCNDLRCYGLVYDFENQRLCKYAASQYWGCPLIPLDEKDKQNSCGLKFQWDNEGHYHDWDNTTLVTKVGSDKVIGAMTDSSGNNFVWVGGYPYEDSQYEYNTLNIGKHASTEDQKKLAECQRKYRQNSYQAGIMVSNGMVYIHEIVYKLAKLEGWTIGRIEATAPQDPSSDTWVINGKSAFQYITEDLCPVATTADGSRGNFVAYFDKSNKFYFVPFTTTSEGVLPIRMGYNQPNSPVISFGVKTKGSYLMAGEHDIITGINSDTGLTDTAQTTTLNSMRKYESPILSLITRASSAQLNSLNSKFTGAGTSGNYDLLKEYFDDASWIAKGANHYLTEDQYAGFKWYETAKKHFNEQEYQYLGYNPYSLKDLLEYLSNKLTLTGTKSDDGNVRYNDDWATYITNSTQTSAADAAARAENRTVNMSNSIITADLAIYGDNRIQPNKYLQLYNFVKGGRLHWTSGKYWIKEVSDSMDSSGFRQRLTLIRYNSTSTFFKNDSSTSEAPQVPDIVKDAENGVQNHASSSSSSSSTSGSGGGGGHGF